MENALGRKDLPGGRCILMPIRQRVILIPMAGENLECFSSAIGIYHLIT